VRKALAIAAILGGAAGSPAAQTDHPAYLAEFQVAEQAHRPFRPITSFDPATSLEEAYAIQRQLIDHKLAGGTRIAGYRGGLMSDASLRQRGVSEPLVGVQFVSGRRASPTTISLSTYRHPAIEMKIGFVFGRDLAPGMISVGQLRRAVKAIVPVIDLPDIGYADPLHYSAVDMVAADISAADYVEGLRSRRCTDLDAETVTLTRDSAPVTQGRGSDSLGDAWQGLRTVVDLAQRHGYRIRRGDLVLTGKLGGKVDVSEGHYVATFSCLGPVSVELTK
jgi:2-keto-4-pentenoate hydratase